MKKLVHIHMLVKAYVEKPPMAEQELNIWFTELVSDINMNVCIPARSNYVDIPGNRGITGQVGLSTSHSSCHVWDECSPAMLQFDLYSCAEYDSEKVIAKLNDFGLLGYEVMLIDREDGFKILEHRQSPQFTSLKTTNLTADNKH